MSLSMHVSNVSYSGSVEESKILLSSDITVVIIITLRVSVLSL